MHEATDRERCRLQGTTRSACRLPRRHDAPVAQRIEHLTTDQEVGGSSPSGRATHRPRFTGLAILSWPVKLISVNHSVIQLSFDHVQKRRRKRRQRGHIRQRGGSFQVLVYAGIDPVTGKRNYLTESTHDAKEADRILRRLLTQVDEPCP